MFKQETESIITQEREGIGYVREANPGNLRKGPVRGEVILLLSIRGVRGESPDEMSAWKYIESK